jgi:hypothetical protein
MALHSLNIQGVGVPVPSPLKICLRYSTAPSGNGNFSQIIGSNIAAEPSLWISQVLSFFFLLLNRPCLSSPTVSMYEIKIWTYS